MNKFIIYALCLFTLYSCDNTDNGFKAISIFNPLTPTTPDALLTHGALCWKASPVGNACYTSGARFHNTASTNILKAKFEKDGTFRFLYNDVEVSGTIEYSKNRYGKDILSTHAKSFIHKQQKINKTSAAAMALAYSNTYLWERISFPGITSEDFLLLVDLDAHPEASSANTATIDKNWVSKFYIR